eukprot:TRINITY_DN4126_c0_g1_i14.p2 TRINITY_DN4126_c0_g1~~TRINITY_DN4126_c0_g1_i14.p2  ORF type:complete len:175 (+),score=12.72 TRINITY_DN4126_c0_g1_i14:122-646(+)
MPRAAETAAETPADNGLRQLLEEAKNPRPAPVQQLRPLRSNQPCRASPAAHSSPEEVREGQRAVAVAQPPAKKKAQELSSRGCGNVPLGVACNRALPEFVHIWSVLLPVPRPPSHPRNEKYRTPGEWAYSMVGASSRCTTGPRRCRRVVSRPRPGPRPCGWARRLGTGAGLMRR